MWISKTAAGRRRKRVAWVVELHADFLAEIHLLRASGVKVNAHILLLLARKLLSSVAREAC